MTRNELIKQCRYYKGEEECPFDGVDQDKSLFWSYEQIWVERYRGQYEDEQMSQANYLTLPSVVTALKNKELNAIPLSLQILLLNRYMHWLGGYQSLEDDVKSFVDWLKRVYLQQ